MAAPRPRRTATARTPSRWRQTRTLRDSCRPRWTPRRPAAGAPLLSYLWSPGGLQLKKFYVCTAPARHSFPILGNLSLLTGGIGGPPEAQCESGARPSQPTRRAPNPAALAEKAAVPLCHSPADSALLHRQNAGRPRANAKAYIKVHESEIADDYPMPAQYAAEEDEVRVDNRLWATASALFRDEHSEEPASWFQRIIGSVCNLDFHHNVVFSWRRQTSWCCSATRRTLGWTRSTCRTACCPTSAFTMLRWAPFRLLREFKPSIYNADVGAFSAAV